METFTTKELALAAYLKAQGHSTKILSPQDPSGYVRFAFQGDSEQFGQLAKAFANGADVCAIEFYQALNALRAEIRYARGAWR